MTGCKMIERAGKIPEPSSDAKKLDANGSSCHPAILSACHDERGRTAACEVQAQPLPTIELSTSLEHFHAEAVRGQCDTGRYRCPYYVWGAGPPLVFIPGLCDDSLSFVMPIARLSRHFRCIAYDLPTGAGDGARLSRYRHRDLVEDLFALLDQLQIEQSYVFGASFGSTVALRALHDRPVRLPRGVLQGGFAYRPLAWGEVLLSSFARWWPWPMGKLPLRTELLKVSHEGPFARVDQ